MTLFMVWYIMQKHDYINALTLCTNKVTLLQCNNITASICINETMQQYYCINATTLLLHQFTVLGTMIQTYCCISAILLLHYCSDTNSSMIHDWNTLGPFLQGSIVSHKPSSAWSAGPSTMTQRALLI